MTVNLKSKLPNIYLINKTRNLKESIDRNVKN